MNPSASGWIEKFGDLIQNGKWCPKNFDELYGEMKKTGLIYGINVRTVPFIKPEYELSHDENAKINLLSALYFTYRLERQDKDFSVFLNCIFDFYTFLDIGKTSFLAKIVMGKKTSSQLEKLMDSRIYLEDNLISKTFNSIITNSLLFIDVLTFKRHLQGMG
ncbi:MAG: hypothetical protein AAFX53_16675, partial [Bacteroidota bacterium]